MGRKTKAIFKTFNTSPIVDKVLVSFLGILAGSMLNLILNKLDHIEKVQVAHVNEFKEYSSGERKTIEALLVNQSRIVLRQDALYSHRLRNVIDARNVDLIAQKQKEVLRP